MQLFEAQLFTANVPLTCISFLTTSLATTWSKMAWSLGSSIRQNLTRSLCHVSSVPGSSAVTVTCSRARVSPQHVSHPPVTTWRVPRVPTWKISSVVTPNHSGESRNWSLVTRWRARPAWDTSSLQGEVSSYR